MLAIIIATNKKGGFSDRTGGAKGEIFPQPLPK